MNHNASELQLQNNDTGQIEVAVML